MNHSPAPWRFVHNEFEYPNLPILLDANNETVCDFGDDTEYYPSQGTAPNTANAALIAAAPELLEACKGLLECLNEWDGYPSPYWVQMQAAKAAIAKAQPTEITT